jgi:Lar family restriction alleviation protein
MKEKRNENQTLPLLRRERTGNIGIYSCPAMLCLVSHLWSAWSILHNLKRRKESMEQEDQVKIKNCPFCGSKGYVLGPTINGAYIMKCLKCGIEKRPLVGRNKAIHAWNRRAK